MRGAWRERREFTAAEVNEIRTLLDGFPYTRRASRRIAMARLRRLGLGIAAHPEARPSRRQFEELLSSGALKIDEAATATVQPQSANVFRVAVGVTGDPVPEAWSAFDQRFQWFGRAPQQLTSGSHLFVLAVGRWSSAVVGLYEAISAGAAKLPGSSNPERWPWAVGVRPLAAIPPPLAEQVEGQRGPQGGLPEKITDPDAQEKLYRAVAASAPPPGPTTVEQRVQEVEWRDVVPDVLEAIEDLGGAAHAPEIVARAVELAEWDEEELSARAWYTAVGAASHVEHVLGQVLLLEQGETGAVRQVHGRYSVTGKVAGRGFGVAYRPAADGEPAQEKLPTQLLDLSELDRATRHHMILQDRLARMLRERGIEPRSPGPGQPEFDLAFEHEGKRFVVEIKTSDPVARQQIRLGVGQVLEYRHLLAGERVEVEPVLLFEAEPPDPWKLIAERLGLRLLRADRMEQSLSALLSGDARPV